MVFEPKVLVPVCDQPMIRYAIDAVQCSSKGWVFSANQKLVAGELLESPAKLCLNRWLSEAFRKRHEFLE
jgi:hypothetical protein